MTHTVTNLASPEGMTDDEFIHYAPRGQSEWLDEAISRMTDLQFVVRELETAIETLRKAP